MPWTGSNFPRSMQHPPAATRAKAIEIANALLADDLIVALTASAMTGDEEKSLAAGCAGYIIKPIQTRSFAQQIRAFLGATS